MAITIGDKIYRNLEEQVQKNKDDIADLQEAAGTTVVASESAVEGATNAKSLNISGTGWNLRSDLDTRLKEDEDKIASIDTIVANHASAIAMNTEDIENLNAIADQLSQTVNVTAGQWTSATGGAAVALADAIEDVDSVELVVEGVGNYTLNRLLEVTDGATIYNAALNNADATNIIRLSVTAKAGTLDYYSVAGGAAGMTLDSANTVTADWSVALPAKSSSGIYQDILILKGGDFNIGRGERQTSRGSDVLSITPSYLKIGTYHGNYIPMNIDIHGASLTLGGRAASNIGVALTDCNIAFGYVSGSSYPTINFANALISNLGESDRRVSGTAYLTAINASGDITGANIITSDLYSSADTSKAYGAAVPMIAGNVGVMTGGVTANNASAGTFGGTLTLTGIPASTYAYMPVGVRFYSGTLGRFFTAAGVMMNGYTNIYMGRLWDTDMFLSLRYVNTDNTVTFNMVSQSGDAISNSNFMAEDTLEIWVLGASAS